MINVYFNGFGYWTNEPYEGQSEKISFRYEANGIFSLTKEDELFLKYQNSLEKITQLLPSLGHPDCEFSKILSFYQKQETQYYPDFLSTEEELVEWAFKIDDDFSPIFHIDSADITIIVLECETSFADTPLVFQADLNDNRENIENDINSHEEVQKPDDVIDNLPLNDINLPSEEFRILNDAHKKYWGNADKSEKDTHPKNNDVAKWLMKNGFKGKEKADYAASIIRPEWAAPGRPSKNTPPYLNQ